MQRLFSFLSLMRPANLVTALADIAAGAAIAGFFVDTSDCTPLVLLMISTLGLYGGGVVFNDVFDAEIDAIERPERAIPSGKVSKVSAAILGISLLVIGVLSASMVSEISGIIALITAISALVYDKWAKHSVFLGPLVMGICRGLNLLLGMSILWNDLTPTQMAISVIPIFFIAAITLTSQGEVHGSNKKSVTFALVIDTAVAMVLVSLAFSKGTSLLTSLPFLIFWYLMNARAKIRAIRSNIPQNIKKAVKTGVISLIPLNATYVAIFSQWYLGLAVVALLPLSIWLSKQFAVT